MPIDQPVHYRTKSKVKNQLEKKEITSNTFFKTEFMTGLAKGNCSNTTSIVMIKGMESFLFQIEKMKTTERKKVNCVEIGLLNL